MSKLYVVGVPIGNEEDITLRALRILKRVEVIFCEDTRVTAKLMQKLQVSKKRLISARSQNEEKMAPKLLAFLQEGKEVCYVSDAGTPCLSDPGSKLVRAVLEAGYAVLPVPGVSAFTSIVSVSPYADKVVVFEGFLPPKGAKRFKRLQELCQREEAFVLYESPHRFLKLLAELCQIDRELRILVGREMTKKYEEYIWASCLEVRNYYEENPGAIVGEFCLLVSRLCAKKLSIRKFIKQSADML